MPNAASLAALANAQLVQTVDSARLASDHFKLVAFLRAELDAARADLETKDNATALTESDRAGSSKERRDAIIFLEKLDRDGYNGIKGIPSFQITDAERLRVYTAYGWSGGNLGDFNDARTIGLARLALLDKTGVPATAQYSAALLAKITEQLAILDAHSETATGGDRVEATRLRNLALDKVENLLFRVRFYYSSVTPEADQTAELLNIGMNPRRDPQSAAKVAAPAAKPV